MSKKLSVGDVISGTLDTFTENLRPFGLFIGVFTLVGSAIEYSAAEYFLSNAAGSPGGLEAVQAMVGLGAGLGGLAIFIASVIAQYLLWEAVLRSEMAGAPVARHRYLAYFGLTLVTGIAIAFGFLLLIVPGLLFMARWMMAPAILIGENRGIFESMGESWESTRGNSTPVILAVFLAMIAFIALSFGLGVTNFSLSPAGAMEVSAVNILLGQALQNLGTALAIALGVFLYKRLRGNAAQVSQAFA